MIRLIRFEIEVEADSADAIREIIALVTAGVECEPDLANDAWRREGFIQKYGDVRVELLKTEVE